MNTRRNFLIGGAVVGGATFGRAVMFALPPNDPKSRTGSTSKALESATRASVADSYKLRNGDHNRYTASATASVRLMAALFENQAEVGETAKAQDYLLSHQTDMRYFVPSPDYWKSLQRQLVELGVTTTTAALIQHLSVSQVDMEDGLEYIKENGLVQFYRAALGSVSLHALGSAQPTGIAYHPTNKAHLKMVQLDRTSCQIIKVGAVVGGLTGNVFAAAALTLWAISEC